VVAGNRRLKLDRIDVEILRTLQENAGVPLKELASKVGLSIPAVRARIDRLMDLGVIKGFTVIVDPSRIAERVRALILCKSQQTALVICRRSSENSSQLKRSIRSQAPIILP
jgi:DNA-binding Lrp family transcriptional regulator